jgi:L-amino acid N-acyltransferase YncA
MFDECLHIATKTIPDLPDTAMHNYQLMPARAQLNAVVYFRDMIRLAKTTDAKGILDIYAPYIRDTSFTFETEVPNLDAFAERISAYLENWPWLVYETNGKIAGYAYGARYRERGGYQWCVESSIYIHDDYQRAGIAQALYEALLAILKKQGFMNVYAVINLPNEKSVKFHERCGYTWFANYENVGYKLGQWKKVGWWQCIINEYIDEPPVPVKFEKLDKDFLQQLFADKEKLVR